MRDNVFKLTKRSNKIEKEFLGGILLIVATLFALIVANSNIVGAYEEILHTEVKVGFGIFSMSMSLLHWINDGLMTLFFLVIGMEIKQELVIGELKSIKKAILPIAAAVGGMLVPAMIYIAINFSKPTMSGWGIPMATDIAFALGILSLVAKHAPKGIAVFLTALAIIDDLGAILVIAIFYTSNLSWLALILAFGIVISIIVLKRLQVVNGVIYGVLGLGLWVCLLKSGVHATIAGVILGMLFTVSKDEEEFKASAIYKVEHRLKPWTTFAIMPLFALANAGVSIDISHFMKYLLNPVSMGIIAGLFFGKQVGIFGMSFLLLKLKVTALPEKMTLLHLYGVSILGGIGFTMSLFITTLSFTDVTQLASAKLAILIGSVLSGVVGAVILGGSQKKSI